MNFYQRQEQARRQSRWLVVLFSLALLAVVVAVDLVVLTVLSTLESENLTVPSSGWMSGHLDVVFFTSLLVLAIVGLASLQKSSSLSGGGGAVARSLGGVRVERGSEDPLRRRLFNVVEEMAIASGVPVPEIYVLEQEEGINAFAAGHLPANAAVTVSRGALERLSRPELQGVIAHEFSHVLNGDMRLNTRLIGLLFGLLVIALVGRTILRWGPRTSKRAGAIIMLAAFAVMVLGYVGMFFGRLIQAAVSRQRERLADASAVQFTREPQGLKGALVKIGASEMGSRLSHVQTEGVAHMLFASGLDRFFSTHPPLLERIRELDPSFKERDYAAVRFEPQLSLAETRSRPVNRPSVAVDISEVLGSTQVQLGGLRAVAPALILPATIAQRVGNPGTEEIDFARDVVQSLPEQLLAGLAGPGRALGVLLALLLDPIHVVVREKQLRSVRERLGEGAATHAQDAFVEVSSLRSFQRLPLLGALMPELRHLPREERRRVLDVLNRLILTDGQIDIFEYCLATVARVYLRDELAPGAALADAARNLTLDQVAVELQSVFSTVARYGANDERQARQAYELGMHHLLPHRRPEYRPVPGWPAALDRALKCLDRLRPAGKEQLVEALVKTISHDGKLSLDEAELLRAICAAVHCPLPPLMGFH